MSNHFHLVAVGDQADVVSLFMMDLNGLYATYRNVTHRHTGRVWQGRFYSAISDPAHVATALRYTELNPVRARMVARAEDGEWSSARAHLGLAPTPAWLDTREFAQNWPSPKDWRRSLETQSRETDPARSRSLAAGDAPRHGVWVAGVCGRAGTQVWGPVARQAAGPSA